MTVAMSTKHAARCQRSKGECAHHDSRGGLAATELVDHKLRHQRVAGPDTDEVQACRQSEREEFAAEQPLALFPPLT